LESAVQLTEIDFKVPAVAITVGSSGVDSGKASTYKIAVFEVVVAVCPFKVFVMTTL
jgi:hypothetical protein